jgi:hypothetical protein
LYAKGSNATGDYCSKCWREKRSSSNAKAAAVEPSFTVSVPVGAAPAITEALGDTPQAVSQEYKEMEAKSLTDVVTPKKKKKKTSYKAMMEGMMNGNGSSTDIEKQKDKIRSVTGGGVFVKIDKI